MDLLREYDFECLPLIDRQFDDPKIQSIVHELIGAEMRNFVPGDYLAYLPYPELKFANSTALQEEMERRERGESIASLAASGVGRGLDMSKYNVEAPRGRYENDTQAWRDSNRNARIQIEQQNNRLMNAEIAEHQNNLGKLYLTQNKFLEQQQKHYVTETEFLGRHIRDLNKQRLTLQEEGYPTLSKLQARNENALKRKLQCLQATEQLQGRLRQAGCENAIEVIQQRKEEAATALLMDRNDAAHNDTVRAYETVNTSST
mmetsp:Transcript_20042/g.33543  ORF Transcript_20042/g.33543 Transcript_20042/m.33543 type:complete len:260 (+) Transcript_20042:106-885(+)